MKKLLLVLVLMFCGCGTDKAKKEGYEAGLIETPPEACPYQPGEYGDPSSRKAWMEGWNEAFKELKAKEIERRK